MAVVGIRLALEWETLSGRFVLGKKRKKGKKREKRVTSEKCLLFCVQKLLKTTGYQMSARSF